MKFGKYLKSQIKPEFATKYVDYGRLKDLIAALAVVETKDDVGVGESGFGERVTSLSMTPNMPESAKFEGKDVTETDFFEMLESEMKKVDEFTHEKVKEAVARVDQLEAKVQPNEDIPEEEREDLRKEASSIGDQFLAIEKYVNINYLAVHKILKKHDKTLPIPCRRFYIMRLHNQRWVKNDYSRLFVRLSQIHSLLRRDKTNNKASDAGGQTFVRTTKKYWVRTEDISRVKHIILQNLPIFQHDINSLAGDSQLTNSVYFDNESLELYHGRLDKTPGAIAIRFRWYATEEPTLVFVERKTHRESWTGEISVKERFTLKENQVLPFLQGKYTVKDMLDEMKKKGKSEADMANVEQLFTEIYSQIDSKQLRPCMRTRYNRTAYQLPNDATVRISLDTNLTMMTENPKVGPDCATSGRWYRDPTVAVPPTEITRFPHAILEVKLSLKEGEKEPQWVTDLLASGMATEVHKFSKFIHGCATLLTDSVRAVPYWVDDPSIRPSILRSQPRHVSAMKRIADAPLPDAHPSHIVDDDDDEGQLPFGQGRELMLMQRKPSLGGGSVASPNYGALHAENTPLIGGRPNGYSGSSPHAVSSWKDCCRGWLWRGDRGNGEVPGYKPRKVPMKIEPKVFLANERTMLSWLNMSVTLGTIAAALIGANHASSTLVGMLLLPVSVLFAAYALVTFYWRGRGIALRQSDVPFHDLVGPTVLASVLVLALAAIFFVHLAESSTTSGTGTGA